MWNLPAHNNTDDELPAKQRNLFKKEHKSDISGFNKLKL